ncbi:unnamed protein product (macronuclear) [Paramecium tetraurelia]|uniref:CLN3 protein n=1 Tax=Paramecium tetraurelia TaxID=5888 RepID=A0DKA6_PARTE|nr:uncharacterized protein GSPATT00017802001 [Paramecium tetraurelia]CAK83473.1 unnamed protein product [Paramecium tetraurelia]|eukprot:XP_001450870.1 hypothetical protein (macronuclear) [Paramecium tetraurelia strain d4-2]
MKEQLQTNQTYGTYQSLNQDETPAETVLERDVQQNQMKYSIAMFLCGLINNTGYVLVATSAQSIAKHFDKESFMSAFNFSLIFLSIGMVFMNAKLFIKIQHKKRIYVAISLSAVSFIIIAVCTTIEQDYAFYISLLGATLCGCMQSFGEATMLGYSKSFSSSLIGFWSSGTGFAGIFGSGFFLVLRALKFTDFWIFITAIPFLLIYLYNFTWLDNKRKSLQKVQLVEEEEDDSTDNLQMSFENMKYVVNLAWTYSLNLGAVYFFEYFVLTCWADRANPAQTDGNYFQNNAYAILAFCYQIGVFVSRSSLKIIQIKNVTLLTIIQGVNCGLWAAIAIAYYYSNYQLNIAIQICLMLWVGLMGGASYVNVNYLIVSGTFLPKNCKELCMCINSMTNNTGIMFATLFAMAISNFWLK